MLASRDFGFMLLQGTLSLLIQWKLLASSWCSSVPAVFATFTFRLGSYAMLGLIRVVRTVYMFLLRASSCSKRHLWMRCYGI